MAQRPPLGRGDLVKIRDRKTGKLSEEVYRVLSVSIPQKDKRRTKGTGKSWEGYAEVYIRAKGKGCRLFRRRELWRVPGKTNPSHRLYAFQAKQAGTINQNTSTANNKAAEMENIWKDLLL